MPLIEITVTIPKGIINVEKVRRAIIDAQNGITKRKLTDLFKQTTDGWKEPPQFSAKRIDTSSQLGIRVYPSGKNAWKYILLNEGSPPHPIRPRRVRLLKFQRGYKAGTKPRVLKSGPYQRFGPFSLSKGIVSPPHPGFKAREFTQTIADEHEPEFNQDMQDAIKKGSH